jgi:BolA family transcriptional regulator, general stress-responsive regulator
VSLKMWIESTLSEKFAPFQLVVEDQSHLHAGHGGWREGGETHFQVEIISRHFAGLSRVAMHRLVNEALQEAFISKGLHALAITAKAV